MSFVWNILLVSFPSYLIGAIPSSYIMGKLVKGIDLREHGSGNLGAANTFRVLGKKASIPVLLFDISKGFIAVHVFSTIGEEHFIFAILAILFAVLGHNYSVFVGFSGGKGVGTTTGAFLAVAPEAVAMCFVLWLLILISVRIVSVASIAGAVFLLPAILISDRLLGSETHISIMILSLIVSSLVVFKHRSNIMRLREGKESKLF